MSLFVVQVAAGFLAGMGLLALGVNIGLRVHEDREADRHAKIALARIEARRARPAVYLLAAPPPAAAPRFYLPGYADPFPRAGRFAVDPGQLAGAGAPQLPHDPASRPATSLVDLDGAVRLMCLETEQYIANLIAGTYHAERNGN